MRVKVCLSVMILLVLSLAACADSGHDNTIALTDLFTADKVCSVAPAELTSDEEWLLKSCTRLYFVYDLKLQEADGEIYCNIWVEHFEKGEKQAHEVLNMTSVLNSPYDSDETKDRIVVALLRQTEDKEIWAAGVGGGNAQVAWPKILYGIQTAAHAPEQEFELDQPVLLGYLAAGDTIIDTRPSVFTNQDDLEELLQNDAVYVLYMKASQSLPAN